MENFTAMIRHWLNPLISLFVIFIHLGLQCANLLFIESSEFSELCQGAYNFNAYSPQAGCRECYSEH